ncbi:protein PIN-LIKES 1-like [Prosopis cineraria]|uniref:protein PIN-LIKES 1-like n=1 Tax=Prosopis cineraria TaxID=364024 RepID=UPI00240FBA9D|nr:protein PIN-LIKES 1-like [Prosopis cineraria]
MDFWSLFTALMPILKVAQVAHLVAHANKCARAYLGMLCSRKYGNMSLIIMPAICNEASSPFGDKDVCNGNGLANASLTLAVSPQNISQTNDSAIGPETESAMPEGDDESNETGKDNEAFQNISRKDQSEGPVSTSNNWIGMAVVPLRHLRLYNRERREKEAARKIFGLILGVVPQFHKALVGDTASLHVVENSISMLG